MDSVPQKRCTKCGNSYPATKETFCRDRTKPDGLHPHCKTCRQKSGKRYYENNREGVIARTVQYAKDHPEQTRAKGRRFYWNHHEQELERHRKCNAERKEKRRIWYYATIEQRKAAWRKYYTENRDAILARDRANYAKHPEKALVKWRKRHAIKLAAAGTHTADDIEAQYSAQHGKCWWCGKPLTVKWEVDHIYPLSRGGKNGPDNLVIACRFCNRSKGNKLPHEWIGRLI